MWTICHTENVIFKQKYLCGQSVTHLKKLKLDFFFNFLGQVLILKELNNTIYKVVLCPLAQLPILYSKCHSRNGVFKLQYFIIPYSNILSLYVMSDCRAHILQALLAVQHCVLVTRKLIHSRLPSRASFLVRERLNLFHCNITL